MNRFIYDLLVNKIRPIELAAVLKKMLLIRREYFSIMGNSWYLDPASNFGFRLLKDKCYEPEMTSQILSILNEGDTFIDLGSNEGYFSILASEKVGKNGKVYCIEPQGRLWEVILRNANKNNCLNIKLIPYAISESRSEISISLSPSINTGSSTFVNEKRRKYWDNQIMNATTLDDLFPVDQFHFIKLIKIDIEGYELLALKGAEKLLEKNIIKNIIIEFHPSQLEKLGQHPGDINELLIKYGYKEKDGVFTCEGN